MLPVALEELDEEDSEVGVGLRGVGPRVQLQEAHQQEDEGVRGEAASEDLQDRDMWMGDLSYQKSCFQGILNVLTTVTSHLMILVGVKKNPLLQSFPSHHAERFRHVLFWEFPGPAWAVASCSSGPQAGGTP